MDAPEELQWAVAEALFDASDDLRPEDNWPDDDAKYGRAAAAVLAVPAIADVLAAVAELAELRQAVWDAYGILGFDQDGDDTPDALAHPPLADFLREFATDERDDRNADADALARDAKVGGIVASNGDPFESLRAIAAMYPVPATADELVPARCRCGDEAWDPHQHCRKSAHGNTCCHCGCTAYPSPSDRDDSEEQR